MVEIFISLVVIVGLIIALVFNTRYRQHPWDSFYPKLAWMRAGMYFCFCWTLSYLSGGLELILTSSCRYAGPIAEYKLVDLYMLCGGFYCVGLQRVVVLLHPRF